METNTTPPKKSAGPADYLANERTFLAWIRTSIALMGFGFVIVKFTLFIRQLNSLLGEHDSLPNKGYSSLIGVGMVALGALVALLAFYRYQSVENQLKTGSFFTSQWLSVLVTLSMLISAVLLVLYLMPGL